jgi:uncharacterized protein YciI
MVPTLPADAYRDDPAMPALTAHLAQLETIERQGRLALAHHGPSALADMAAALFAAVVAAQADALPGADRLDAPALEDIGEWFLRLDAERRAA